MNKLIDVMVNSLLDCKKRYSLPIAWQNIEFILSSSSNWKVLIRHFAFWLEKEEILTSISTCKRLRKKIKKLEKQNNKVNGLLRRFYNIIEMSHLNDNKLIPNYCEDFKIPKQLGEDIFNYLQSKDEFFKETTIKRQKRYRKKNKLKRTVAPFVAPVTPLKTLLNRVKEGEAIMIKKIEKE